MLVRVTELSRVTQYLFQQHWAIAFSSSERVLRPFKRMVSVTAWTQFNWDAYGGTARSDESDTHLIRQIRQVGPLKANLQLIKLKWLCGLYE
jgi:hypothetical protein